MKLICFETLTMGNCYVNIEHIRKLTQDITGNRTLVCTGDNDYVTVDCPVDKLADILIKRLNEDD